MTARELQRLPGIGPRMAEDLERLGVRSVKDMARRDPERLYARLNEITGQHQDPCVLYAFRCAVYAARTERPDRELLKWWNWKDRRLYGRTMPSGAGSTSWAPRRLARR